MSNNEHLCTLNRKKRQTCDELNYISFYLINTESNFNQCNQIQTKG